MLSEGRGTTRPFELIGAPWLDAERLAERMNRAGLAGVHFRPATFEPTFQKHARATCGGCQIHVTSRQEFAPVKAGVIPDGRCAVLRYPGNTNNLEPAALYLYRDWLPASGEEARDFPIYSRRQLSAIPEAGMHEPVVEVFLPLK